ncbi:molybdopterin molybdotransferase MoeA [Rhodococcus fascians]|uniref:molybdopterin molybdotransferase MoeA n=1 Tax=Rhodococcoides fascians TaxID=1828 RepID=UPI0019566151|nr:gephyrin-like molybdotransferase Glp [Rhodococcus fascians]MBM7243718.1 molybdopterin molybdotransferase MoeA [Rhodococcus fascians]MBY3807394.1 molybdopterin molybdotransferase MoeA [Rhodococcus fascians]MBY3838941.1 molybdopterin molybdotransferase MoeA [Rhodococcus fascians]MBY3843797.1 molybdopterin molybdotransferase MoeA [Rhodococcus fascians]MBY3849563.1 molybdopterin molybdotransferase MoeA [Rhodococcus fascians]
MKAVSVEEHAAAIESLLADLGTRAAQRVPLTDALGRVAFHDVTSPVDLPLFRNSQMDGYAVDSRSVQSAPVTLPVSTIIAAGPTRPSTLTPGSAAKIMTGAPIPDGADAIVPVEDTTVTTAGAVTVERARGAGEFVREQGSDVRAGTILIDAGRVLEPRHISVLAAVGLATVDVRSRPRVAVVTTGAELADAGETLSPGQIFDSNGITLAAHLRASGADVVTVARSTDDPERFRSILTSAAASAELIITSGGVSMGDFEVVKDVLAPLGGQFGSVRMQPGGPQGITVFDGTPVLSFPGNPVSTVVSYIMFARNIVRRSAGLPPVLSGPATLFQSITSPPSRRQLLRGKLRDDGRVELVAGPGSHLVAALAWADVLIDIAAETTELAAGSPVEVWPL